MQSKIGMAGYPGPPFGLESGIYSGEYSWEWAELRRLYRKVLIVLAGLVAIFGIFALVALADAPDWFGLPLFLGWAGAGVTLFLTLAHIIHWSCPRCGNLFHAQYKVGHMANPFARKCIHCGLPKWADPDPDPRLKLELYPFRSDQIYKLGEINIERKR
jgi:hypothetical protein